MFQACIRWCYEWILQFNAPNFFAILFRLYNRRFCFSLSLCTIRCITNIFACLQFTFRSGSEKKKYQNYPRHSANQLLYVTQLKLRVKWIKQDNNGYCKLNKNHFYLNFQFINRRSDLQTESFSSPAGAICLVRIDALVSCMWLRAGGGEGLTSALASLLWRHGVLTCVTSRILIGADPPRHQKARA